MPRKMRSFSYLRRDRWLALIAAGASFVFAWLAPSGASAYEDRVTLDLSVRTFVAPDVRVGPLVGGSLGLSDVFTVRAAVGYDFGFTKPIVHTASGHVDLLYLVDIVEWVPFFGLRAGGELTIAPDLLGSPLGGVVAGLDHFLSRDLLIGLDLAYTLALYENTIDHRVSAALRLSLLFDQ